MNTLSVSSYSLREQFGPLAFDFVDPQGNPVHLELPYPKLLNLSEFPARARDTFGVDTVETVAFQFAGLDDPELDLFGDALAASGVRLVNAAIDVGDLLEPDADKRAADIKLIERWIERFTAMGSQFVRVNPGSPFSHHNEATPPAQLIDGLGEVGAFAKRHGSRLLVENHGGPSGDPVWMGRLLDAVGHDACGLLLDLGNFDVLTSHAMAGFGDTEGVEPAVPAELYASLDLTPVYDAVDALAMYTELVSLKANYVTEDGAVGPVDLPRALGILAAHGYAGPLSVEYEGTGGDPWAKSARVLEVAESALAESGTAPHTAP
ncbi:sugar phosphate isomerase/epimerase [Streptomyces sp. NBC_01515]|uniref:sugar phosphate isomerase/epimerase family protein n=1 Tax=Streptomyces sp. NBC_01515 TaxID=2903890 RepID=UPI003864DA0D